MRGALLALLATVFVLLPLSGELARADGSGEVTATARANPVLITLFLPTSAIRVGEDTTALALVENAGGSAVTDVIATLHVRPDGVAAAGGFTRFLGTIEGNGTAWTSWDICGLLPGNYVLLARATATMPDGEVVQADSDARLLEVTERGRKPCGRAYR